MDIIKQIGALTLGSRLKRLSDKMNLELSKTFKHHGIEIDPSWLPVLFYLNENHSASIFELAKALNFTHPAVVHLVNKMEKKNMLEEFKDDNDRRKRFVKLSKHGEKIFESARPVLNEIETLTNEILNSGKINFLYSIDSLEKQLNEKSFFTRADEKIKKMMVDSVDILKYSPAYKEQFKQLNIEWLEKYFTVEPEDERILNNPEGTILKGGEIFFAKINNEIVGTCAVLKKSKNEFELAKMAVTEKAKGKQAGKKLALAAIGFAYSNNAKILSLQTSKKLVAAINLYENLGFEKVNDKNGSVYSRELFRMELNLQE